MNYDKVLYKNFDKISDLKFYSIVIRIFLYSCTSTLLQKCTTFATDDSYLSKIYILNCSYFKNLSPKIYTLKFIFLKKRYFKFDLLKICCIKIHQIFYNLLFSLIKNQVTKNLSFYFYARRFHLYFYKGNLQEHFVKHNGGVQGIFGRALPWIFRSFLKIPLPLIPLIP